MSVIYTEKPEGTVYTIQYRYGKFSMERYADNAEEAFMFIQRLEGKTERILWVKIIHPNGKVLLDREGKQ